MGFVLATLDGQSIPKCVEKDSAAAADFPMGSLLLVDGNGDFAECGADPALVAAVAASGVGPDTAFGANRLGVKGFPPGRVQAFPVQNFQRFRAKYVGTLPSVTGGTYGVVKDTDGEWKVDFAEVTAMQVKLVELPALDPLDGDARVTVIFLTAKVQPL